MNVKRVYRLYREEGLAVRRRKRKRVAVARAPQATRTRLNERWGLDFMSDVLVGGRRYRILNVVELLTREDLASTVDTSLPASRVIAALEEIALECGYPASLVLDNGTSSAVWRWMRGPTSTVSPLSSSSRASRSRTRPSRASTAGCATNS